MKLVGKVQSGDVSKKDVTKNIQSMANNMDPTDVKDMSKTEQLKKLKEYIRKVMREMNVTGNVQGYMTPNAFTTPGGEKKKAKKQADLTGYSVVDKELDEILTITENRWLELKKEDSPVRSKIGRGISNINKQLNEIDRFLNWYGRLKNESGIGNQDFWKRTNQNIYKIKERLIKIEQNIRKISG